ncbi:MAG TPA: hypothetical protein VG206_09150 [Terriglobia bacterium]|nr:hypothetical protein [Terriglobia bacterium]
MALSETPAVFYLTTQGEQALGGWFGKRSAFPVLMMSSDSVGAWILLTESEPGEAKPVMLLKWEYVATVTFEASLESPLPHAPIGFHARASG